MDVHSATLPAASAMPTSGLGRFAGHLDRALGGLVETVAAVLVLVDRSAGLAKFDYPTFPLVRMAPEVWEPSACPLCAGKQPFVHPGS